MRDIDELVPDVAVLASKAPELVIMRAIVAAAQEWCEKTRIWRCTDTAIVSPPDCIGLCSIEGSVIIEIDDADLAGTQLEPVTQAWLNENYRGWAKQTEIGSARFITQLNANSVRIYPLAEEGELTMQLVLKPAKNAEMIPSILIDDYSEDIVSGAVGRVLTMVADWANPSLGAAHLGRFQERIETIAIIAAKGKQNARLRAKPRWF